MRSMTDAFWTRFLTLLLQNSPGGVCQLAQEPREDSTAKQSAGIINLANVAGNPLRATNLKNDLTDRANRVIPSSIGIPLVDQDASACRRPLAVDQLGSPIWNTVLEPVLRIGRRWQPT